jgi:phage virion morphogenesis protein
MAGINLSISVDDVNVRSALNSLLQRGQSLRPALLEIGEHLKEVHEARFVAQIGPDGRRWAPLSPEYQAKKKSHANMILVLNEYLATSWRYQATDDELLFGTDRKYAAAHHFGRPEKNLPARPIIGIAEGDPVPAQLIADYLMDMAV